jgi:hypothetical protein
MIVTVMGQQMGVKFVEEINVFQSIRNVTIIALIPVIAGEQPMDATNAMTISVSTVIHIAKLNADMIQTVKMLLMAANIVIKRERSVYRTCHTAGNIVNLTVSAKELVMAVPYVTLRSGSVSKVFLNVVMTAMTMMIVRVAKMTVFIVTKAAAHLRKLAQNVKIAAPPMMIALEPQKVVRVA